MSKRPGFSGTLNFLFHLQQNLYDGLNYSCRHKSALSACANQPESYLNVSRVQSVWSPSCPGSTWPTRCGSRSRISSTESTARRWASSTRSKCLTRGSRTIPTRSSSRASPLEFPSGNPAPSAPRTWRGSWLLQTRSGSPSPGEPSGQVTVSAPVRSFTDCKYRHV